MAESLMEEQLQPASQRKGPSSETAAPENEPEAVVKESGH